MPEHDSLAANSAERFIAVVGDCPVLDGSLGPLLGDRSHHDLTSLGATSDDCLATLDAIVSAAPESLVIIVGSSDFAARRSVEHLVRNIELLLVSVRRELPGIRTLVQSILPREREFASAIRDANRHLRQFAPISGSHFLDVWPALALDDGELNPAYSSDRVNLNEAGIDALRGELAPAIERLESAAPMSRPISIIPPGAARR